jgi:hypothetical protein
MPFLCWVSAMNTSIGAGDEVNFEAYSKLSARRSDSGRVSNHLNLRRSVYSVVIRLLAGLVACSVVFSYAFLSDFSRLPSIAPEPGRNADEANPFRPDRGSSRITLPKLEPIVARAEYEGSRARSPRMLGPKPKEIYFKGEYFYGKMCARNPDGAWALYRTENFLVKEVVRASDALRDQLKDSYVRVHLFAIPSFATRKLREGETYMLRLAPSDKTWTNIEQGLLSEVGGDELEFVGSIPD